MSVTSVYRYIIDDVIRNIRAEFVNEGLEDTIIAELQHMWESRLMQSGAVQEPTPPSATSTTASTTVSTSATTTTSTSTTNTSSTTTTQESTSPSSTTTTTSTSSTSSINNINNINNNGTDNNNLTPEHVRSTLNTLRQFNNTPTAATTSASLSPQTFGRPSQFMPPNREGGLPPHIELPAPGSSQSLRSIMNIPQNDGSVEEPSKEYIDNLVLQKVKENQEVDCTFSIRIPQMDGNDDELDDYLLEEHRPDNNVDSLGSDLDDDEDNDPDPVIEHFVLCQYEKVTRIKNKRKCNFKDGVMHLNGRDALFHKANGEFVWR